MIKASGDTIQRVAWSRSTVDGVQEHWKCSTAHGIYVHGLFTAACVFRRGRKKPRASLDSHVHWRVYTSNDTPTTHGPGGKGHVNMMDDDRASMRGRYFTTRGGFIEICFLVFCENRVIHRKG